MLQAERLAVRAIVFNPEREVLLLRASSLPGAPYWYTPGGGVESGESDESALRRELREELSLADFELGPLIFRRSFQARNGRTQAERIYLVRCARFDAAMSGASEARYVDCLHWWALTELLKTEERIYPSDLAVVLLRYLEQGECSA
jgi:ADP-ribose pyrophosphatase YjhB (NUDIX family)